MSTSSHSWQFFRAGGFDQVRLRSAADYRNLAQLDQKLWAALACPVAGLDLEEATLKLVDEDGDGRVRAPELLGAIAWCDKRMKDLGALSKETDSVPLASLRDDTPEGKALVASARRALAAIGKPDGALELADVAAAQKALDAAADNGDGVVPVAHVADDDAKALATDIVAALGGVPDRSGEVGVDLALVDAFQQAAKDVLAWKARATEDAAIFALGDDTAATRAAVEAVHAKVDDFFARCKLAAWDERALPALDRGAEPYDAIGAGTLTLSAAEAEALPLAHVGAGRPLPLADGVNPAWADRIAALRGVVQRWRGTDQTSLDEASWKELVSVMAAYGAWTAARPATPVADLADDRLQAAADGVGRDALVARIAQDAALAPELEALGELERLVRYHRDLDRLLHNFVSFEEFYSPKLAVFQAGTLYLDSRAATLTVFVDNPGAHAGLASMSQAYLVYCDITRPSGEKKSICAAFTDGDSDYLLVGRNGLFYDRQGRDWDARIVKIVANPISVREAFWLPYKKLVRMIEDLIAKRAAEAEKASDDKVGAVATTAANAEKVEAPAKPPGVDIGTVAAMGVAVGAVGAFLTTLIGYLTGLFALPFWQVVLVLFGAVMMISGPSMLIAWMKLRQRNLGPILDANGWAVNARVKLSVKFGKSMTTVAELPKGVKAAADDAFSDRPSPWPRLLRWAVIVGFLVSLANTFGLVKLAFDAAGFTMPEVLVQKEPVAEEPPAADAPEQAPPAE